MLANVRDKRACGNNYKKTFQYTKRKQYSRSLLLKFFVALKRADFSRSAMMMTLLGVVAV